MASSRRLTKLETRKGGALSGTNQRIFDNYLTLWKDADPDIPILKEARAEYAKVSSS
jgi:hypothetical protein